MIACHRSMHLLRSSRRKACAASRYIHTSAAVLQEGHASPSTNSSSISRLDALAALRRKVEEQGSRSGVQQSQQRRSQEQRVSQDGSNRFRRNNDSRGGAGRGRTDDRRGERRMEGRPGNSQQRQRRSEGSNRGARRGGGRGGLPGRFNQDETEMTPAPIQKIHPVTEWQHSMYRVASGINRVPYKSPEVTVESVRKTEAFDAKTYKPLYQAERALKLHFGRRGVKMGPIQSPTLVSRPRNRLDDAPVPIRKTKDGSVAAEAREARVKLLQEKSGGDYERWEIGKLAKDIEEEDAIPAEVHAAEAVTHNDDLGPSNKLWTVDTVKKILNRNRPS